MSIEQFTNAVFGPPPAQVKPSLSLEERVEAQEKELKELKKDIETLKAAIKLLMS